MAKNKYEVVDYTAGGFFIHGGSIGEIYVKSRADADLICDALNMSERLKMKKLVSSLNNTLYELEALNKILTGGE